MWSGGLVPCRLLSPCHPSPHPYFRIPIPSLNVLQVLSELELLRFKSNINDDAQLNPCNSSGDSNTTPNVQFAEVSGELALSRALCPHTSSTHQHPHTSEVSVQPALSRACLKPSITHYLSVHTWMLWYGCASTLFAIDDPNSAVHTFVNPRSHPHPGQAFGSSSAVRWPS